MKPPRLRSGAAVGALASSLALTGAPALASSMPFIGELMPVGFNWCPRGWAPADGRLLPVANNSALFALIGTLYGGDGKTTFALPDLRGRAAIGTGQGPGLLQYQAGQKGGAESVTVTTAQMPAHTHAATTRVTADIRARASDERVNAVAPAGQVLASGSPIYGAAPADQDLDASAIQARVTARTNVASAGGKRPVGIRNPYLAMTWCIAVDGIFPSRP